MDHHVTASELAKRQAALNAKLNKATEDFRRDTLTPMTLRLLEILRSMER